MLILSLTNQPQLFQLPGMVRTAGNQIDAGRLDRAVTKKVSQLHHITANLVKRPGKEVPISYNKGKTRNPSKIKGFRACPYSFSKNITLRSRSKGGVEKQELKLWTKI